MRYNPNSTSPTICCPFDKVYPGAFCKRHSCIDVHPPSTLQPFNSLKIPFNSIDGGSIFHICSNGSIIVIFSFVYSYDGDNGGIVVINESIILILLVIADSIDSIRHQRRCLFPPLV
jgi:hypothetical protein